MTVADRKGDGCGEGDIEDIGETHNDEDLFSHLNKTSSEYHQVKRPHRVLKRSAKIARKTKKLDSDNFSHNEDAGDACTPLSLENLSYTTAPYKSTVPGTETVFVKTWGCSHNSSDSEYMAGLLATYGYRVVMDESLRDLADLWLLNSCTVKSPAESQFRNAVEQAQKSNKHVVVAGCVPQGASRTSYINGISVIGVQQIDRVVEVVEETLKGHSVRLLGQKRVGSRKAGGAPLLLPKVRKNPLIEIIAISTGCLNSCTYCKTKHARGNLGSYPPDEIIARAKQAFEEGVRELWITSEDTGAYGRDIGTTLPEMLQSLVAVIPDGCKLRIGMTNPPYILDHLTEISEILQHPRVYAFIHIPVQAGSDKVLYDMKREYTRADFERVCDTLLQLVPKVYIATDVICGFPTETDEDFEETLELARKYRFPSLFINQFYPRPGTAAANVKPQVLPNVKKARSKAVTEIFNSYSRYAADRIGNELTVLVTELARDGLHYVGHTDSYEQVLISPHPQYMGSTLRVRITECGKHSMKADVVEELLLYNKSAYKPQLMPVTTTNFSDKKLTENAAAATETEVEQTASRSLMLQSRFLSAWTSILQNKCDGNIRALLGVGSFFVLVMAVLYAMYFPMI